MVTFRAVDSGESFLEITAFQVIVNHLRDNRTKETIFFFKSFLVISLEIFIMVAEQIPQRGFFRISRVVYRRMFNPLL